MLTKFWESICQLFKTDNQDLLLLETVESGADSIKVILDLSKAIKEQSVNSVKLSSLASEFSQLIDALSSPLAQVVEAGIPFVNIITGLLKIYVDCAKKDLSFENCIEIIGQMAYLDSLRMILLSTENHSLIKSLSKLRFYEIVERQLKRLDKEELSSTEVEATLSYFHGSKLASLFNETLLLQLLSLGLKQEVANIFVERISCGTPRYFNQAVVKAGSLVKNLANFYGNQWHENLQKYQSIDDYLQWISEKPKAKVFNRDSVEFKDIYISLKVRNVDTNGHIDEREIPFDLHNWVDSELCNSNKAGQIILIQSCPGRGKSMFCRMFSDYVRRCLYPIWIPILLDLRRFPIKSDYNFEELLQSGIRERFSSSSSWLTDRNTQFLFILDGFDEILMEGKTSGGLESFLAKAGQIQDDWHSKKRGHRLLMAGRTLSLQSIKLPSNLSRVEIMPLSRDLQNQWFSKWSNLVGAETALSFQQFLQDPQCPIQIRGEAQEALCSEKIRKAKQDTGLAQEPLLLYLLAVMHQEDELTFAMFESTREGEVRNLIYQKALDGVLQQRYSREQNETPETFQAEDKAVLKRILSETGLCVIQSGGEWAPLTMIKENLEDDVAASELLERMSQQSGSTAALINALTAFYLQPANGRKGAVEFVHKSFGEFLYAQKLYSSLEKWTEYKIDDGEKNYCVSKSEMEQEIYNLLGFGALTPEIIEYLTGTLISKKFNPAILFGRLTSFYRRWCCGEFINELTQDNYPRKKTAQLQHHGIPINLRQVDVYTGLNVIVLLLTLHHYGQSKHFSDESIIFYPCGERKSSEFDEYRLLRTIGYSLCIDDKTFAKVIGPFLNGVKLRQSILSGVYLHGANLRGADLRCTYLDRAYLYGVDLSNADLRDINFRRTTLRFAMLSGVNLSYADLSYSNLSEANFTQASLDNAHVIYANCIGTNFSDANLSVANFKGANLKNANFSRSHLSGANLSNANLNGACLEGTHLSGANLSHANLRNARLNGANFSGADLNNLCADWTLAIWENVKGLETAVNVPNELRSLLELKPQSNPQRVKPSLNKIIKNATFVELERNQPMALILAGDVGGTKTHLRLMNIQSDSSNEKALAKQPDLYTYPYTSGDFEGLAPIVKEFLRAAAQHLGYMPEPQKACFAISGPIIEGRCSMTNLSKWSEINAEQLQEQLAIAQVTLINDFEAVSYGVSALDDSGVLTLQMGEPKEGAPMAVIGVGTGLGESFLAPQANGSYQPFASEGGHAEFAPHTLDELRLLNYLYKQQGTKHISVEQIVSGTGFITLYQFLRDYYHVPESEDIQRIVRMWEEEMKFGRRTFDPTPIIAKAALDHRDHLSERTMRLFVEAYGSEAGNLALKVLPYGGLYLAGGITIRILDWIQNGDFLKAFTNKGRMKPLLERIPIYIIREQRDVGLIGASICASRL